MNNLNFGENIVSLRRKKGITQEQLADFIGVTKASVSKWENKQSLPDIILLPKLAAFFDITIDELLGYEAILSKEQIQKIYLDLSSEFAQQPFDEVMTKSKELVKKYYSFYPFLMQMCILWLNHFMVPSEQAKQIDTLKSIINLCSHIIDNCNDIGICNDVIIIKALANLQLGNSKEVINTLEETFNPYRVSTAGISSTLIQAYILNGNIDKAENLVQITLFTQINEFIDSVLSFLYIHKNDLIICEKMMAKAESIINAFNKSLFSNSYAKFNYQSAVVYCIHNKKDKALKCIEKFGNIINYMMTDNNITNFKDDFFTDINKWLENSILGITPPRDKKVIIDSIIQMLTNPDIELIKDDDTVKKIKSNLTYMKANIL